MSDLDCPNCGLFMLYPSSHTCPPLWLVRCADDEPSDARSFRASSPEGAAQAWVDRLTRDGDGDFLEVGEDNHVDVFVAPVSDPTSVEKVWVWLELAVRTQVVA